MSAAALPEERQGSRAEAWRALLLLALAALAATTPLLLRGPSCGHDFDFHLLSWMEVARDWGQGLVWPHWIASANYGAGEPRLVFYPPGSWLLGAALGDLLGWKAAPIAFTGACLLLCGVSMQRLAREWLPWGGAVSAGCLYTANPYMLFVVYERTAYGELLAAALLPVLLLFALRPRPPVAALALVTAGIWLANAPAGVIACYTLLFLALIRLLMERNMMPGVRMGAAVLLGLGMDGAYLLPAAYEQRWVEIARAASVPGMRIRDSFLFTHTGEPYHDQVLRTASWLAVLLLGAAAAGYGLAEPPLRRRLRPVAALAPLVLFLLLPVSQPVWQYAPHLRFLQFPWRWLMILGVVAALCAGAALLRFRARRAAALGTAAVVALSVALCSLSFYQRCDEEDAVASQRALFRNGGGVAGTDEYTPAGAETSAIQRGLPPVRVLQEEDADEADSTQEDNPAWTPDGSGRTAAVVTLQQWTPQRKRFVVRSAQPGFAVLRLMDYPAWRVTVNGRAVDGRPHRDDGLLVVPLTPGVTAVEVEWRATRDVEAGGWVSAAGVLLWLGVAGAGRRRRISAPRWPQRSPRW